MREPLKIIKESGQKAAAIVQDLLTLARRGVSVTEVVNLNSIVSEYMQSPEYGKLISYYPEIDIAIDLDNQLLNIEGSPIHLFKTIMNLVSNAAEAMTGVGALSISTENQYVDKPLRGHDEIEEGDYATVTVSDTGAGMSKTEQDRIFEPFIRKRRWAEAVPGKVWPWSGERLKTIEGPSRFKAKREREVLFRFIFLQQEKN